MFLSNYNISFFSVFTYHISASNDDYISKTETITLDSTNTEDDFVVTISNDNVVENTETFGVNVTTSEAQVRIQDETVVITILDEDSKLMYNDVLYQIVVGRI